MTTFVFLIGSCLCNLVYYKQYYWISQLESRGFDTSKGEIFKTKTSIINVLNDILETVQYCYSFEYHV